PRSGVAGCRGNSRINSAASDQASSIFERAGVAAPTVTERLRRAVIQIPIDPRSISPHVPGSGVGVGVVVPTTNVPFTNASVSLPCSSLTGRKFRVQLTPLGSDMRNSLNVGPSPTNPITLAFKPPASSKNDDEINPMSLFGSEATPPTTALPKFERKMCVRLIGVPGGIGRPVHQSKQAIPPMPSTSTPVPVNLKEMLSPPPKFGLMNIVTLLTATEIGSACAGDTSTARSAARNGRRYLIVSSLWVATFSDVRQEHIKSLENVAPMRSHANEKTSAVLGRSARVRPWATLWTRDWCR